MTDPDPAVMTWMIALAPRPRPAATGRHWWRDYVTGLHRDAMDAWLVQAEAASNGWAAELADFKATNPPPRLKDFLTGLATGHLAPDTVGAAH